MLYTQLGGVTGMSDESPMTCPHTSFFEIISAGNNPHQILDSGTKQITFNTGGSSLDQWTSFYNSTHRHGFTCVLPQHWGWRQKNIMSFSAIQACKISKAFSPCRHVVLKEEMESSGQWHLQFNSDLYIVCTGACICTYMYILTSKLKRKNF